MGGILGGSDNSLPELKRLESSVFGSTDQKSPVKIRIAPEKTSIARPKEILPDFELGMAGLAYLGCFSLFKTNGELKRPCYLPGSSFKIDFFIKRKEIIDVVLGSLWLNSFFGGLGARSRRGFGGFRIEIIKPEDRDDLNIDFWSHKILPLEQYIKKNLGEISKIFKDYAVRILEKEESDFHDIFPKNDIDSVSYPCFVPGLWDMAIRCYNTKSWSNALNEWGRWLRSFRVFGQKPSEEEELFGRGVHSRDYEKIILPLLSGESPEWPFNSLAFGLPLQFKYVKVYGESKNEKYERRSSPFMFRLIEHRNKLCGLCLLFRNKFLPADSDICLDNRLKIRQKLSTAISYSSLEKLEKFIKTLR